jgi:hypothetical protein
MAVERRPSSSRVIIHQERKGETVSHNDEPSRSFTGKKKKEETSFCLLSPWERSYIESHKIPKGEDFFLSFSLHSFTIQQPEWICNPMACSEFPNLPLAPTFSFHFLFFLPFRSSVAITLHPSQYERGSSGEPVLVLVQ